MRRLLTALAILVAPIFSQESEEPEIREEIVEEEDLGHPFATEGRIFRGERDAPTVFVCLREGGLLQIEFDEEWQEVTLDDLGTYLAVSRDRDIIAQQQIGKSGLEEILPHLRATRLFLSLDADPTVPWQHIQWVMTLAVEQKYRKLEMSDGKRRLLACLPIDRTFCPVEGYQPPPEVQATVHLVARKEQPAKWGGLDVLQPTDVRCKCGDMETTDLAEVTGYLKRAKKAVEGMRDPKVVFYGVIQAGHKVPYAKVFDVMEAFVKAEIPSVDFWGTGIPPKTIRGAKRLPYPASNYGKD